MLTIVIPPGLDGAPSKVMRVAVFVLEGHLGDGPVAGVEGVAGGMLECSEDAHFEVV